MLRSVRCGWQSASTSAGGSGCSHGDSLAPAEVAPAIDCSRIGCLQRHRDALTAGSLGALTRNSETTFFLVFREEISQKSY